MTGDGLLIRRPKAMRPGVVFLSGFGSDMLGTKATYLESVFSKRKRSFLRFDYTGHGSSSGLFEEGCIGEWASDAVDAITRLTEGPQILIGSSMGGWIALLLARSGTVDIAGLVGIAAAPDFVVDFERSVFDDEQRKALASSSVGSKFSPNIGTLHWCLRGN